MTVNDIMRAAGAVDGLEEGLDSELVVKVVLPALTAAEMEFGSALSRINMARRAASLNGTSERD